MIYRPISVIYKVTDIPEAKLWYSNLLQKEPYFNAPSYVGFNMDGFELGLYKEKAPECEDSRKAPKQDRVGPHSNVTAYWQVNDMQSEFERISSLGAKVHEGIHDVGGGIQLAAFWDPFGNPFGIIYNPGFTEAQS